MRPVAYRTSGRAVPLREVIWNIDLRTFLLFGHFLNLTRGSVAFAAGALFRQQLVDLPYQLIAALNLDNLNFLELLKQRAGRVGVVSQPFEPEDELSLSGNMLFAERYTLLGLNKPRFQFCPTHKQNLARIVGKAARV